LGGVLGRLFHEFAVVLSLAILISLWVSLTTTPMMCAALLQAHVPVRPAAPVVAMQVASRWRRWWARRPKAGRLYRTSLAWALRHQPVMWLVLLAAIGLNVYLYKTIPKGFFPQQDTGRIFGSIRADQSTSFQAMQKRLDEFIAIVRADPAVESVTGFTVWWKAQFGANVFVFEAARPTRCVGRPGGGPLCAPNWPSKRGPLCFWCPAKICASVRASPARNMNTP